MRASLLPTKLLSSFYVRFWGSIGALAIAVAINFGIHAHSLGSSEWALFLGRFHTLALHLPIGALILVVFLEAASLRKSIQPEIDLVLAWALPFAALTAAAAFGLGVILAGAGSYPNTLIAWHRGLTLAAMIGVGVSYSLYATGRRMLYRAAILLSSLLLTFGAHFGGSITHGDTFLMPPSMMHDKAKGTAETVVTTDAKDAKLFDAFVMPVLKAKCISCHGEMRAEANLRLDSLEAIKKGGTSGPSVIAGDPTHSSLLARAIVTDPDNRMPPEGKEPLTKAEISLFNWWIKRGATDTQLVSEVQMPPELCSLFSSTAPTTAAAGADPSPASNDTKKDSVAPTEASASNKPSDLPASTLGHSAPNAHDSEVLGVFQTACVSCHRADLHKGGLALDTIDAAKNTGRSGGGAALIASRIQLPVGDRERMPPSSSPQLSPSQVSAIAAWAGPFRPAAHANNSAAPEKTANPSPATHTSPTTNSTSAGWGTATPEASHDNEINAYQKWIAPSLEQKCASCHGGEKAAAGLDVRNVPKMVTDKDILPKNSAKSRLVSYQQLAASDDDHMPPNDHPQSTPRELEQLKWWIDRGAHTDEWLAQKDVPGAWLGSPSTASTTSSAPADSSSASAAPSSSASTASSSAPNSPPPASHGGCASCTILGATNDLTWPWLASLGGAIVAMARRRRRSKAA